MTERPSELFRGILKEFRATDSSLSSELKVHDEKASDQHGLVKRNASLAQQVADGYREQIEGKDVFSDLPNRVRLSSEIESQLESLKTLAADFGQQEQELKGLEHQIQGLEQNYQTALGQEKLGRVRKGLIFATFIIVMISAVIFLHFRLLATTTLSFNLSLDGKPLPPDRLVIVTLDGKSFASGNNVTLGSHQLSVSVTNAEPFEQKIFSFYGAKNLGTLSLESLKGSLSLLSDPPDAEFVLSDDTGIYKQGELPFHAEGLAVGAYQLKVRRQGWELDQDITVARDVVSTNKTTFPYGAITVMSDPIRLTFFVNGVETGKTPKVLHEIRPGKYKLSITDGENELVTNVDVEPNDQVKQNFVFRYFSLRLDSMPAGATVTRKGEEVGKTPVILDHMTSGESTVEMQLDSFVTTNFLIHGLDNSTTKLTVKLVSEHYLADLSDARRYFANNPSDYTNALRSAKQALQIDPDSIEAVTIERDCDFGIAVNVANALLKDSKLDKASAKIDELLALRPSNADVIDLEQKLSDAKLRQAQLVEIEAKRRSDEQVATVAEAFDQAVANVAEQCKTSTTIATQTKVWKAHATISQVKGILSRFISRSGQWTKNAETNSSPNTVTINYIVPGTLIWSKSLEDSKFHFIVQISQLPDESLDIRAKMIAGVLADANPSGYRAHLIEKQNSEFREFESYYDQQIEPFLTKKLAKPGSVNAGVGGEDNSVPVTETSKISASGNTVFSDDFSEGAVDSMKWTASGNAVMEADQTMKVLTLKTDAGGKLTSLPFAVKSTGLITVTRRVFLHHANSYFEGHFAISIGSLPIFSIQYADMIYSDGNGNQACHGFFIARNNASAIATSSQGNVSPAMTPSWDTWFDEMVTYDPKSGDVMYYVNGINQGAFNVGALPQTDSPTMTLSFDAWGWYTGHQHLFKNLVVTQAKDGE